MERLSKGIRVWGTHDVSPFPNFLWFFPPAEPRPALFLAASCLSCLLFLPPTLHVNLVCPSYRGRWIQSLYFPGDTQRANYFVAANQLEEFCVCARVCVRVYFVRRTSFARSRIIVRGLLRSSRYIMFSGGTRNQETVLRNMRFCSCC